MEHLLLSIHVLAGIVFVGGSGIAASLFPRYVPVADPVPAGVATGTAGSRAGVASAGDGLLSTEGSVAVAGAGAEAGGHGEADGRSRAVAVAMHRITRGYSLAGIIVPAAGIVLAFVQGRTGEIWITLAMVLTAAAGLLLAVQIYPRQRDALATPGDRARLKPLSMLAGVYNLLWAVVVVLMIVRPGAEG
ncbi:membrane protein [Nonomuraea candida]|uniref:membrane protein n=1 Tax=Nonomuraea candida TaxID=359159 RepID=UPI0005B8EA2D|nr:membrane protein [Nonomuraea candida]